MTTETYGIDRLKQAVHLAIAIPVQATKTIKNKFQFFDILAFIDELKDLAELIKNKNIVGLQLKDLTEAERLELLEFAKSEFDIPDDQLEGFIEDALGWVNSTVSLIGRAKNLRK